MARAKLYVSDEPSLSSLTDDLLNASIRAHVALSFKISPSTKREIARDLQSAIEAIDVRIDCDEGEDEDEKHE